MANGKAKPYRKSGVSCKDCIHSYEPHSKALDGHMILCRCKFFEFSRFLEHDCCDKFSKK